MPKRDRHAERCRERIKERARQRNLRQKKQRLAFDDRAPDQPQVHLGLARGGHAEDQGRRKFSRGEQSVETPQCVGLAGRQSERRFRGQERRRYKDRPDLIKRFDASGDHRLQGQPDGRSKAARHKPRALHALKAERWPRVHRRVKKFKRPLRLALENRQDDAGCFARAQGRSHSQTRRHGHRTGNKVMIPLGQRHREGDLGDAHYFSAVKTKCGGILRTSN